MLVRSGVIDEAGYLKLVEKTVNNVLRGAGRSKQSVAESSFDAWSKYYRQDENAPNAIVSYYTKGSLVALALDLTLRARTAGRVALDDVMRAMWQRYGSDFYGGGGTGIGETQVEALFDEVSGLRLKPLFDRLVRGTEDLPLAKLFAPFGLKLVDERKADKPALDVATAREGADCKLTQVHEGGAAHKAGLSAGDILLAIDGLRVGGNLEPMLARYQVGDAVSVHAFRRDELMAFSVTLQGDRVPGISLTVNDKKNGLRRPSAP
jgi:predicted metalloprotease with PDZ domain